MLVRDKLFIDGMIYCQESKKQGKRVVLARDKLFIDVCNLYKQLLDGV